MVAMATVPEGLCDRSLLGDEYVDPLPKKASTCQRQLFPDLPASEFDILYADPPWDYKGQLQHAGQGGCDTGGAIRHYGTVTLDKLKELDVPAIAAEDSLLFLWATNPHLDQAIELGKSWGFSWATVAFVWDKVRVNPGFYTMSRCELCLVFKKGKIPTPRGARNVQQFVSEKRGAHSQKPQEVRRRIEGDVSRPAQDRALRTRSRAWVDVVGSRSKWLVSIWKTGRTGGTMPTNGASPPRSNSAK